MPSPFPGMNPYLESFSIWREVHNRLVVALANDLGARLRPKYYVAIETRTYLEDESDGVLVGIPDAIVFTSTLQRPAATATVSSIEVPQPQRVHLVEAIEVKQRFLEVRLVKTHEVIVAIEILSPKNKRGDGRISYLKKRQALFESQTHLAEIDLLRAYSPMPLAGVQGVWDYRILVSDAAQRPQAVLYGFNLRDPIPSFWLPLQSEDRPILVDLQPLLHTVYDQGNFDLRIDYQQPPPEPPLSDSDRLWVQECIISNTKGEQW